MPKRNPPATIDLAIVTAEQYGAAITAIWMAAQDLAARHGWCGEWITYMSTVGTEFPVTRSGRVIPVPPPGHDLPREWFTDDGWTHVQENSEFYAAQLNGIRGRILRFVNDERISLDEANTVLEQAGLARYEPAEPASVDVTVELPSRVMRGTITREQFTALQSGFRQAFIDFIVSHGLSIRDLAAYQDYPVILEVRRRTVVPADQTADYLPARYE